MKNIIRTCAALTVMSYASYANTGHDLCGFYVGGQAGGSLAHQKYVFDDGPGGINAFTKGTASNAKPAFGLMAGYNYIVKKSILLGAEIGLDGVTGGDTLVSSNLNLRLDAFSKRKGLGYTALAKFGVIIAENTAAVIGLGVKSTESTFVIKDLATNVTAKGSKRSARLHLLAGVEGLFKGCRHVGWRVAYNFTQPQTVTIKNFPDGHGLKGTSPFARIKRTEHQANLGVFWKF